MKVVAHVDFDDADLAALLCPNCKQWNLHQARVDVFNRREDQKEGTHVWVDDEDIGRNRNIDANPSLRRQGIAIAFTCEQCMARPVLGIAQHKGTTYIAWIELCTECKQADACSCVTCDEPQGVSIPL